MSNSFAAGFVVVTVAIAAFYLQEHSWEIKILKSDVINLKQRVEKIYSFSPPQQKNDLHSFQQQPIKEPRPIALISAKSIKSNDPAHLLHVQKVFDRLGYQTILGIENYHKSGIEFDIFWNHEYPFTNSETKSLVAHPKQHQKINHIPGSGFYTSKVALATANLSFGVPLAFALPKQKAEFEAYAKENPKTRWVQKSNAHRNIKVLPIEQLDTNKADTFIQKFVENPLLIDGNTIQ
uniref:Uncharacterized protein n=1 Tax=Panagrolaimus sp. ES5 TaxID=591445 RepID=A0AC34FUD5_9BILA